MEQKELHVELLKFAAHIARFNIWDYEKNDGSAYQECEAPSDGHLDSHTCLMAMIGTARGILGKPASNKVLNVSAVKPDVTLVAEVFTTGEYDDSPAFAVINVTSKFLAKLVEYRALCKERGVQSVTTGDCPESWDNDDDLNIRYDSLQVFGDDFWFSGNPKHADYGVETRGMSITELLHVLETKENDPAHPNFSWDDGILFYAGDPGILPDLIDQYKN